MTGRQGRQTPLFYYRYHSLLFRIWQGNTVCLEITPDHPPRVECIFREAGTTNMLTFDLLNATTATIPLPDHCAHNITLNLGESTSAVSETLQLLQAVYALMARGGKFTVHTTDSTSVVAMLSRIGFERAQRAKGLAVRHQGVTVVEAWRPASPSGGERHEKSCVLRTRCVGQLALARVRFACIAKRAWRAVLWLRSVPIRIRALAYPPMHRTPPPTVPLPRDPRRLLVFSMGGLGDLIRMFPFLNALRNAYPAASITLLYNGGLRDIDLGHNAFEEAVALPLPRDIASRFMHGASPYSVYATCPDIITRLRRKPFDVAWVFGFNEATGNFGTALLTLLHVQYRIGVHYGTNLQKLNWHIRPPTKKTSLVDFFDHGLAPLGLRINDKNVSLSISEEDRQWARDYFTQQGIPASVVRIVIHPGAGGVYNSKRWPPERFAALADLASSELQARVLLTGSLSEVELVQSVANHMTTRPVVAAGALRLRQLAAVLAATTVVVTNDTAVLHLAGAVRTPHVIGIFGPTDGRAIVPRDPRFVTIQSALPCSPCSNIDGNDPATRCSRPIHEECLEHVSVADVFTAIKRAIFYQ